MGGLWVGMTPRDNDAPPDVWNADYSQAWVAWKVQELLDVPDVILQQVIAAIQHELEERMKHGD